MEKENKGVIYCATGNKYVNEAIISSRSLKSIDSNLSITLFTSKKSINNFKNINSHFNEIFFLPNPQNDFIDKINAMLNTPYEETLFLDTDTYVLEKIEDLFILLKRFELAAAHAPIRISPLKTNNWMSYSLDDIPTSFPEFNTGVIAYRKNQNCLNFIKSWHSNFIKNKKDNIRIPDQPSFRETLYNGHIKFTVIPPEYNCRINMLPSIYNKVKILHGRSDNFEEIREEINKSKNLRVYVNGIGILQKYSFIIKVIRKFKTYESSILNLFKHK